MYFRHFTDTSTLWPARSASEVTRRQFLKLTTLAGSGLTLGVLLPGCGPGPSSCGGAAGPAAPLAITFRGLHPDNPLPRISAHLKAGQGGRTCLLSTVSAGLGASLGQL